MKLAVFIVLTIAAGTGTPAATGERTHPQKITIEFVEELRIGPGDSGDQSTWTSPATRVSVDKAGNMYVADPRENRVSAFNPAGQFLRTVASKGAGPGEFTELLAFTVMADGSALGLELQGGLSPKLSLFDSKLAHNSDFTKRGRPQIIQHALFSQSGDKLAAFYIEPDPASKTMHFDTALLDTHFETLQIISSKSGPAPDPSRFGQTEYWVERIAENLERFFSGIGIFNFDSLGNAYTAISNRYQVTKWSPDLSEKLLEFQHQTTPILITDADRQAVLDTFLELLASDPELSSLINPGVIRRALERANLPPAKNPIFAIIPMEDGKTLVVHDMDLKTRRDTAHLFSAEGLFMGEVSLPDHAFVRYASGGYIPKMEFRNGRAYTIATDENLDNHLIRYSYRLVQP